MSTKMHTQGDEEDPVNSASMHEGRRLRALIEKAGVKHARLANEAGVQRAATTRWFKAEKFSNTMWASIRRGLLGLGIDPRLIRPDDEEATKIPDLVPIVRQYFKQEHIQALREILEAPDLARKDVLKYIYGRLDSDDIKKK
jgi:transcriptional regulator with XRE-family HTH domain